MFSTNTTELLYNVSDVQQERCTTKLLEVSKVNHRSIIETKGCQRSLLPAAWKRRLTLSPRRRLSGVLEARFMPAQTAGALKLGAQAHGPWSPSRSSRSFNQALSLDRAAPPGERPMTLLD